MKNIAVCLSGCGVFDGSEINEAVLTLLAIDRAGEKYECLAPNMPQHHVVNHLTHEDMQETRNVLVESARIARGKIKDIATVNADDYDGLIFPGGFGAAKNLCDFALKGTDYTINQDTENFVKAMQAQNKPVGFICIAPTMIAKLYPAGTKATIGNDKQTADAINALGGTHVDCPVKDIVIDEAAKVVSTPAYMLAEHISDAAEGIDKLVKEIIIMAG